MKKNNKGFTLIELLAGIVVLAIIALITVPQVLGFTDSARKGAAKTSVLNYIDAFEKTYAVGLVDGTGSSSLSNGYYKMSKISTMNVDAKGKVPTAGWIKVESNQVVGFSLVIDDKYVVTSNDTSNEPTVADTGTFTAIPAGATVFE